MATLDYVSGVPTRSTQPVFHLPGKPTTGRCAVDRCIPILPVLP